MNKVLVEAFLHSSKEQMIAIGKANGLKAKALDNFMYALYEVQFDLEIDVKTGEYKIIKVKE